MPGKKNSNEQVPDSIQSTVEPKNEQQGTDDKNKTQNEQPEFTKEQQDWINDFVSRTKLKNRKEMDEYKKKVDSAVDQKINEKLAEQQRRAKMTAEEKAADDRKRLEKENQQLKSEIEHNHRLSYGQSIASQYKVPISMVNRLIGKTDEETEANMKDFAKAFNDAVQQGVDQRLAGTPKPQQGTQVDVAGNKSIDDLSLEEQTKLFQENKDLYNQLTNH